MKIHLKIIFSIISLVAGFFSLDVLYYAFKLFRDIDSGQGYFGTSQLLGIVLYVGWIMAFALYLSIIKRFSIKVTIIEEDPKTGKQRFRYKWFDVFLQIAFIITGMLIRWIYLSLFYFKTL